MIGATPTYILLAAAIIIPSRHVFLSEQTFATAGNTSEITNTISINVTMKTKLNLFCVCVLIALLLSTSTTVSITVPFFHKCLLKTGCESVEKGKGYPHFRL